MLELISKEPIQSSQEVMCINNFSNKNNSFFGNIVNQILETTHNDYTIDFVLDNIDTISTGVTELYYLATNKNMKCSQFNKALEKLKKRNALVQDMKYMFLRKTMELKLTENIYKKMLDLNDENMLKTIMIIKTIPNTYKKEILDDVKSKKLSLYNELIYINHLSEKIKFAINTDKYYPLMYALITDFPEMTDIYNDKDIRKDEIEDIQSLEFNYIKGNHLYLSNEEYDIIKKEIEMANIIYPTKIDKEEFLNYVKYLNTDGDIVSKYPKIFVTTNIKDRKHYDKEGLKIDIEEMCKLITCEREKLIEDLIKTNNEDLLSHIEDCIIGYAMEICKNDYFTDKEATYFLKVADICYACEEKIREMRESRYKDILDLEDLIF